MNGFEFYSRMPTAAQPGMRNMGPGMPGFAPRQGNQMSFNPQAAQAAGGAGGVGGGGEQLSPQMLDAVFSMQGANQDQARVNRQMQLADQLRRAAPGMTESISPGRGRVGMPNWLGGLASVLASYKASKMQDDADVQSRNIAAQMGDARRRYYEAATGTRRAPLAHMGDEGE